MNFLKHSRQDAAPPLTHFGACITGWMCLIVVLFWIVHRIWAALFIPWWFNTDEVVFFSEVIRQLRLDPSQTFFDIPGTPFMTLSSIMTALWWCTERLTGWTLISNPSDFAFANVQGVFTLMRMFTLTMYVVTVALTFDLVRRCAGTVTAVLSALLLASLPIYVQYSHFVRTESFGLALCLGAIWIVLHSGWRGTPQVYCTAGILTGVAMAARFHFGLVGFPVVLAIFLLRDRRSLPSEPDSAEHVSYRLVEALSALFVAGAIVAIGFRLKLIDASGLTNTMMLTSSAGPTQYASAKGVVANLWLLLGIGGSVFLFLKKLPKGRRWIWPVVNPFTLLLVVGFAGGFVLSHPAFLWRGEYQLRSIQFYSDWVDPTLQSLGSFGSWWNVTTYYFTTAFPERWLRLSFLAGVGTILWKRHPVQLAFLGGALLCFVAHPVTMKLWPHHVIPWLPFLCFVAAAPSELVAAQFTRFRQSPARAAGIVLFSALILIWACVPRLRRADEYLQISRARTDQIAAMNSWLSMNVPSEAYLLVSYYALNDDGFLKFIENGSLAVPSFVKKHRNIRIWWLERSLIDGQAGFLCISRADIAMFRDDFERRNPGSTYDPFQNPAFQPIARFGGGYYELQVFKFDFRADSLGGDPATAK